MTDDQRALAEESVGRAKAMAARYARLSGVDRDDLESSAIWAAVEASQTFKPKLGGVWRRWAGLRIKGSMIRSSSDKHAKLRVIWPDDEPAAQAAESVEETIDALPDGRMKDVCRMIYRDGMTQGEIGQALGVSQQRIAQLHQGAITILRERLAS